MKLLGKRKLRVWVVAMIFAAALSGVLVSRAAAQDGVIQGQILDVTGKPWVDMGIEAVSDQGAKSTTKTDKDGNFVIRGLRSGLFTVAAQLPAPCSIHPQASLLTVPAMSILQTRTISASERSVVERSRP